MFSAESFVIVFSCVVLASSRLLILSWHSDKSAVEKLSLEFFSSKSDSVAASFSLVLMHSWTDCSKSLFRTLSCLPWFSDVSCKLSYSGNFKFKLWSWVCHKYWDKRQKNYDWPIQIVKLKVKRNQNYFKLEKIKINSSILSFFYPLEGCWSLPWLASICHALSDHVPAR